jgi:hypothetical protein
MPRRFRKSKLDDFIDIVGVQSDKDVAVQAGVTPENVRTFRMRRVIPAGWKGQTEDELRARLADRGQLPEAKPKRRKPKKKRKERASKLDPYKHLLGEVPDRMVASMAGVSPENVRAYRKRRSIPATWRDGTAAAAPAQAVAAPTKVRKKPGPKPGKARKKPGPKPGAKAAARAAALAAERPTPKVAAPVASRDWAWRLIAEVGDQRREYVTFGGDMLDAIQRGTDQLGRLARGGQIIEAHRIARVL